MRTIKELLIIVRDNLGPIMKINPYNGGICGTIKMLAIKGTITNGEGYILFEYLRNNVPKNAIYRAKHEPNMPPMMFKNDPLSVYWWVPRSLPPRFKWLNKQIEAL